MWALMWYIRLPESSVVLSTASTNRVLRVQLLEVPHAQVVEMTMSPLTTIESTVAVLRYSISDKYFW